MSDLQMVTKLGVLDIVEVYMEYDVPRLFACTSESGALFLSLWVGEEPGADHWLLMPISERRLAEVRTGRIPVRTAILNAEDGWMWRLRTPYDDSEQQAYQVAVNQLDHDELPEPEAALDFPDNHLKPLTEDVLRQAKQARREVLLMALESHGHGEQQVPSSVLGNLLINTQGLGVCLALPPKQGGGRPPKQAEVDNTLMVCDLYAASFGIRLESRQPVNLLGESPAATSISRMMDLFETGDNREKLQNLLGEIGARAAARYKGVLRALSEGDAALKVQWGSPTEQQRHTYLPLRMVRNTLDLLAEVVPAMSEKYELVGNLVGLNNDKWRFDFISMKGDRYAGEISPALKEKGLALPADGVGLAGTAVIEETVDVSPVTGQEKSSYVLLDMIPAPH